MDKSTFVPLAWLAAPLVIVQAARLFIDAGPSAAPASPPSEIDQPGLGGSLPPPIAPRDLPMVEWLREQRETIGDVRSPLDHPPVREEADEADEPEVPILPGLPPVRITGIIGSADHAFVSVGGIVHRVGDEIAPGWKLTSVDVRNQVVEVRAVDGRRHLLRPERPFD